MLDICKLLKLMSEANRKLGEFNEKINQSNAYLSYAIHHLIKLESLYSTRIDGTQTTIDKVYESNVKKMLTKINVPIF